MKKLKFQSIFAIGLILMATATLSASLFGCSSDEEWNSYEQNGVKSSARRKVIVGAEGVDKDKEDDDKPKPAPSFKAGYAASTHYVQVGDKMVGVVISAGWQEGVFPMTLTSLGISLEGGDNDTYSVRMSNVTGPEWQGMAYNISYRAEVSVTNKITSSSTTTTLWGTMVASVEEMEEDPNFQ